jgi:type VI secretion system protein
MPLNHATPSRASLRFWACLLGLGAAVSGCSYLGFDAFFRGTVTLQVVVAEELNRRSPVAVELVVAYDRKVLAQLQSMTAAQWFAQREQLIQQYGQRPRSLDAWPWEWVPGQVVPRQKRRYRVGVAGAVIFANYFAPGDHRAIVDPFAPILLELQPTTLRADRLPRGHGVASEGS